MMHPRHDQGGRRTRRRDDRDGLYELRHESLFVVTDSFDNGSGCLEIFAGWQGTGVPDNVSTRLATTTLRVTVEQDVRLRLLRRAT
jgi:hypothetical protein